VTARQVESLRRHRAELERELQRVNDLYDGQDFPEEVADVVEQLIREADLIDQQLAGLAA
jgi:hypothetical protein